MSELTAITAKPSIAAVREHSGFQLEAVPTHRGPGAGEQGVRRRDLVIKWRSRQSAFVATAR